MGQHALITGRPAPAAKAVPPPPRIASVPVAPPRIAIVGPVTTALVAAYLAAVPPRAARLGARALVHHVVYPTHVFPRILFAIPGAVPCITFVIPGVVVVVEFALPDPDHPLGKVDVFEVQRKRLTLPHASERKRRAMRPRCSRDKLCAWEIPLEGLYLDPLFGLVIVILLGYGNSFLCRCFCEPAT